MSYKGITRYEEEKDSSRRRTEKVALKLCCISAPCKAQFTLRHEEITIAYVGNVNIDIKISGKYLCCSYVVMFML